MTFIKSSKHLFLILLVILATLPNLNAESGIYDRIGIINEHGRHGAVPEENIDLFTGNLTLKNLDIQLPGPNGFDLNIWRVYNSKILKDRLLGSAWGIQQEPFSWVGIGWSMHMGRLHAINTETPVIEYPDGRWETAYHNIDDYATFITRDFAKLDKTNWKLYFKDGTVWTFGALANVQYANMVTEQVRVVTQITNSYGHQINITYDASGSPRMSTITDSMGRTVNFVLENNYLYKLDYIAVKNATGSVVYYDYTVDEFNGDYYRLDSFDPPVLPAVTYEYGNGLASNWELLAVNTSYGGRMEYEYAEQTFYYQVYALQTKVIHEKRIKFSSGSTLNTWVYTYPSYYNSATGTVQVTGPSFTTYATYHAYTAATPWKIGLLKEKYVSDGSSSEQYGWTAKTISDTRWYVLNIDMGQATAPLMLSTTKNRIGDSSLSEEYLYERSATSRYGLPTRINVYGGGSLKNYRKLQYYFETYPTFTIKHSLNSETLYNSSNTTLKQTIISYYANGAINSIQKWKGGSTYLLWDYGYASSNPNNITITVDMPGTGGTETMIYRYGVLATLTHPGYTEFTRTISAYDSSILYETNQHGAVMGFSYDNLGRITAIDMPSGFNNITASWSTNYVTITQGSNNVFKYWDGMGRDTGYVEQGDGINLYYRKSLDSEGRVVSESKGSTNSTDSNDYVYNAAGQVKKITDPRGKITTISMSGNQKTVTDANSHASAFEYNHLPGLVSSLTDPAGKNAIFTYDGAGRLLSTSYNSSRTQSYAYNAMDQVTTETHPETGTITYAYNAANNLETKTWGGQSTAYTYNTSNLVLTENAGDGTTTYGYDSKGRVSSITSNLGWSKTSIGYNSFGAVSQETITIPGLSAKTVSYGYDGNNQLARITYPDGRYAAYTNNGLNMPETISFNGSTIVNAITYGINKQPTLVNISANGTSYAAAYNGNGGLTTAQLKKSASFLYDADYAYDGVGNITSLNNSTPALNASFSYDVRNRLTGVSYTPSGVGRVNNFAYSYDEYGNMTQATENGSMVFYKAYTSQNRISDYSYDSRGNLTANPLYNYTWDNRNHLSQITSKLSGESEGAFAYDEKGMRMKAIKPLPPAIIAITSPTAGVEWIQGTTQTITWTKTGTMQETVAIRLIPAGSSESDPTTLVIANGAPNSGSFSWTIPTTLASGDYFIRVRTDDSTVIGDSPNFKIKASITVTTPTAGVEWCIGSTYTITWTSSGVPAGPVDIILRLAGAPYANPIMGIAAGTANDGTEEWTIPDSLAPGNYLVRIRSINDPSVYDDSEDFLIKDCTPISITVTSPSSYNEWCIGNTYTVTWISSGITGPVAVILRQAGAPSAPPVLGIAASTDNDGAESWTVPDSLAPGNYLVRIRSINDPSIYDDSEDFLIKDCSMGAITVTNPHGEIWYVGSQYNIQWESTNVPVGQLHIILRPASPPDAPPVMGIAADTDNDGSEQWTIPDTVPAGNYLVRIRTVSESPYIYDDSMAFAIVTGSSLKLIAPNGIEKWLAGSTQNIAWSGGEDIRELKIEYSTDLGSTYQLIADRAPNTGSYQWPVPETVSDHCLVRISDANGQLSSEKSVFECDLTFAIKKKEGMDAAKPLLSLWLKRPALAANARQNFQDAIPLLALRRSELDGGYQLNFGEYTAGLADSASLFENPQQIKVQWDIMNSRGTLYLNQKPVFRDILLLQSYEPTFSPCLVLRAGEALSAFQIDDFQVKLVDKEYALGSKTNTENVVPDQYDDSTDASTPLLLEDFESYHASENLASGGWLISQTLKNNALRAEAGSLSTNQGEPAFATDTQTAISGAQSGKISIPTNETFTLTKAISWPERVPFAVSAKPFAIIRSPETKTGNEKDSYTHPEKNASSQAIADESDQDLKGPHAGVTATTPVIARASVYTATYYIHSFDGKLLAEYDAAGVCVKDYIYMGNKFLAEYQPVTATKYYYASDQINSTRIITNSSGTVVYSALFDPYGGMQKQWVNTYQPSLKFSGKERESKSEMDYFGARYYDHQRYRFISVDPVINKDEALEDPQLWNLYAYCGNNPISYFDPDGRKVEVWARRVNYTLGFGAHTFIRITPDNPKDFNGQKTWTLSGENKGGRLASMVNWENDVNWEGGWKGNWEIKPPKGKTDTEFIKGIMEAFNRYKSKSREYEKFPEVEDNEGNCHTITTGALVGAGVSVEEIKKIDPSGYNPGLGTALLEMLKKK